MAEASCARENVCVHIKINKTAMYRNSRLIGSTHVVIATAGLSCVPYNLHVPPH